MKFPSTLFKGWRSPEAEPLVAARRQRNSLDARLARSDSLLGASEKDVNKRNPFGISRKNNPAECFSRGEALSCRASPVTKSACYSARSTSHGKELFYGSYRCCACCYMKLNFCFKKNLYSSEAASYSSFTVFSIHSSFFGELHLYSVRIILPSFTACVIAS